VRQSAVRSNFHSLLKIKNADFHQEHRNLGLNPFKLQCEDGLRGSSTKVKVKTRPHSYRVKKRTNFCEFQNAAKLQKIQGYDDNTDSSFLTNISIVNP
jgi:hypothetical protein